MGCKDSEWGQDLDLIYSILLLTCNNILRCNILFFFFFFLTYKCDYLLNYYSFIIHLLLFNFYGSYGLLLCVCVCVCSVTHFCVGFDVCFGSLS